MTDHADREAVRSRARQRAAAMGYRTHRDHAAAEQPAAASAEEPPDLPDLPDVPPRVLYQLLTHDQLTPAQAARARRMFAWASRVAREDRER